MSLYQPALKRAAICARKASCRWRVAVLSRSPLRRSKPEGSTSYLYDANGNPTATVQAPGVAGYGFISSATYDALNRVKTTTDPKTGSTQFSYDGLGNVTSVIDPRSLRTQYPRDGLGQVTQLQSPDTGSSAMTYDLAGNLLTRTDSRGVQASYSYDALNRLTSVTFALPGQTPAANPAPTPQTYSWTYDQTGATFSNGIGRLTTASFPEGNTSYAYDAQGRVLRTSQTLNPATGTNSQVVRLNTCWGHTCWGQVCFYDIHG